MRKLLAAVDFSPASEAVLERAAELAEAFSAELTVLHVATPDPDFVGYEAGPDVVREARARELRWEHRALQASAEKLRKRGISTKALLIQGPSVAKILEEAGRLGVDAIVLGTHGHGVLRQLLLGSVSSGVVKGSDVPVHLVPSPRD